MAVEPDARPEGIPGSTLPGPFPVGSYAAAPARPAARLRARAGLRRGVVAVGGPRRKVCFELRDGIGALPCSMWRDDWDALRLDRAALADGVAGRGRRRLRLLPGLAHLLAVVLLRRRRPARGRRGRPAGPARAAAQGARRRGAVRAAEARCTARSLPRTIGVVTGERGKARDDVLAGPAPARLGGPARVGVRAGAGPPRGAARSPARCRTSPPCDEVEVIVVARGGGSLADLFAFCDETLCRTVALLRVPVIASVGHHTDRTLIDDVAAVALLDADARRRGGRAGRLRRAPARTCSHRGAAAVERRAAARCSSAPARWPQLVARARRARRPPPRAACTSSCARCAPAPAAGVARRARARAARTCSCSSARPRPRTGAGVRAARPRPRAPAPGARRARPRAHARARLRAGRGRRRRAGDQRAARRRARPPGLRFADGRLRVRQDRQERLF